MNDRQEFSTKSARKMERFHRNRHWRHLDPTFTIWNNVVFTQDIESESRLIFASPSSAIRTGRLTATEIEMTDPRINLKKPIIAGVLAFLVPGAGHLYQGRMFKAGIYFVCILGLFFTGMAMADWKAVQPPPKPKPTKIAILKYSAQLAVGLPSMYGLVQRERYYSEANQESEVFSAPFSTPFVGEIEVRDEESVYRDVQGTLHLEPVTGDFGDISLRGRLQTTIDGHPEEYLLGQVLLGKRIKASELRNVEASLIRDQATLYQPIGTLRGGIPRPFMNWFEVPMDEAEVQQLHADLGKYHELAMVFTWIAGLLNVLAIWDAVEGPAYGYNDEQEQSAAPPTTA